jgi:3D (Asp-Asp-Asp) domain-containing protein
MSMMLGINVLTTGEPIFYTPSEGRDYVEETREDVANDTRATDIDGSSGGTDVADTPVVEPDIAPSLTLEATAYTAYCNTGCIGVTATGVDVNNTIYHEGKRIIATDPNVIPLGSHVTLTLDDGTVIEATSQDTGGVIKGNRLDLLVGTKDEAWDFGRQDVAVEVH